MEIDFMIIHKKNPIISIDGYLDVYNDSDYCLKFYDQFGDITLRIPLNPYNYYCKEYYDYLDLTYYFERDEAFMTLVKEFAESEYKQFKFTRPYYYLVLEKI